jgi:predicted signal transduction protein with EAL and GGDEF domain
LREALREPLDIDGQRLDLEASIGIALLPGDGTELSQVLRRADLALAPRQAAAPGGDAGRPMCRKNLRPPTCP